MRRAHRLAGLLISCALIAAAPAARLDAAADEPHGHVAVHGGCLNEIGGCENGHAEIKLEGARLRMWLVGGGSNTAAAMRVPDPSIALAITVPGQPPRTLVLPAKPLILAEETVGSCSYFEASADWLAGAAEFKATGGLTFNGKKADLVIEYPHGYDPDHDAPAAAPAK
jgi:hypothetical protein